MLKQRSENRRVGSPGIVWTTQLDFDGDDADQSIHSQPPISSTVRLVAAAGASFWHMVVCSALERGLPSISWCNRSSSYEGSGSLAFSGPFLATHRTGALTLRLHWESGGEVADNTKHDVNIISSGFKA